MINKDVKSSYIKSIGYDNGKIQITFRSGFQETREGSREDFEKFYRADSPGKYFNEHMKKKPLWKDK